VKQSIAFLVAALALGCSFALVVPAASAEEQKREAPQIDAQTGKRLNEAIELVNAEKFAEAKAVLREFNMEKLSPYEQSRVLQMQASVASSEENYAEAAAFLEKAVTSGGMSDVEIANARYQIAQMYMVQEKWAEGVEALKEWFAITPEPNSGAYYLLAIGYYRMDDHRAALDPAQKAVDMADNPQPNWVELLLALRLEAEQYDKAVPLLKYVIQAAPDKRNNWMQLIAVYRQQEKYDEALAVAQLAYMAGHINNSSDIQSLADLQAFAGVPYRAATMLEKEIKADVIKPDSKLWEKVSYMWIAARDYDKALPPLSRAASSAPNGDLYVRMAELQLNKANWKGAEEALRQAVSKGNLKDPGNTQLMLGIALFSQDQTKQAREAFARAAQFPKTRQQADVWIKAIDSKQT
jgi:tetratricopeptide (TPR) repeat protein